MDNFLKQAQSWWQTDGPGYALAGGCVVLLLIIVLIIRRFLQRRRQEVPDVKLVEKLGDYPPPPPLLNATHRVTVHNLPVRFRLVVAAPLGREAESIPLEDVDFLLDGIVPNLPGPAKADLPRIRVWPTQLSHQGFIAAFRRNTQVPHPDSRSSRWILMVGKVLFEGRPFGLGLALLADQVNTLGTIVVQHPHEWMGVLRITEQ
jgi:hypothetical protein